ncbi:predicted protein [Botrytis cinerea T4]|uniref:Uncharacterized protein n=1 Tax=Botryotinia fuckeliana (strain T4) TaxID=999810 RepID=G2YM03_BOTF4|nr:predicted protein [Botrytis cinerea T4]
MSLIGNPRRTPDCLELIGSRVVTSSNPSGTFCATPAAKSGLQGLSSVKFGIT